MKLQDFQLNYTVGKEFYNDWKDAEISDAHKKVQTLLQTGHIRLKAVEQGFTDARRTFVKEVDPQEERECFWSALDEVEGFIGNYNSKLHG